MINMVKHKTKGKLLYKKVTYEQNDKYDTK